LENINYYLTNTLYSEIRVGKNLNHIDLFCGISYSTLYLTHILPIIQPKQTILPFNHQERGATTSSDLEKIIQEGKAAIKTRKKAEAEIELLTEPVKPLTLSEQFQLAEEAFHQFFSHRQQLYLSSQQGAGATARPVFPHPASLFNAPSVLQPSNLPPSQSEPNLGSPALPSDTLSILDESPSFSFTSYTPQLISTLVPCNEEQRKKPNTTKPPEGQKEITICIGDEKIFTKFFSAGESNHQQPPETTEPDLFGFVPN